MKTTNKYQAGKERAREEAINWQLSFGEHTYTWSDLAETSEHFERLGKRYGLIREFRENAII